MKTKRTTVIIKGSEEEIELVATLKMDVNKKPAHVGV